ncbi:MAG TPA: hypothetical protein VEL07_07750 [Planctomycetota bacterium]|nr:hypothetical protein [Planctomycetota bacterium]
MAEFIILAVGLLGLFAMYQGFGYATALRKVRAMGYRNLKAIRGARINPGNGYSVVGAFDAEDETGKIRITVVHRSFRPWAVGITRSDEMISVRVGQPPN